MKQSKLDRTKYDPKIISVLTTASQCTYIQSTHWQEVNSDPDLSCSGKNGYQAQWEKCKYKVF